MNIALTINADTPEELTFAIKGMAAQYQSCTPVSAPAVPMQNPTPAPAVTPANTVPQGAPSMPVTTGPALTPMPPVGQRAPTISQPHAPVAPPPATNPAVPLASAPTYSLDQIAKAGAELAQAGKINDLLSLLQQYGVQAVTQLKPEQIGSFATALRGLGAQL